MGIEAVPIHCRTGSLENLSSLRATSASIRCQRDRAYYGLDTLDRAASTVCGSWNLGVYSTVSRLDVASQANLAENSK